MVSYQTNHVSILKKAMLPFLTVVIQLWRNHLFFRLFFQAYTWIKKKLAKLRTFGSQLLWLSTITKQIAANGFIVALN